MAKLDTQLLRLLGKLEGVVFYKRNGKVYARKKATLDPNRVPSEAEELTRINMSLASSFLTPIKVPVEWGFSWAVEGFRTGLSVAKGYALANAVQGEKDNRQIVPSLVKISMGTLAPAADVQAMWEPGLGVKVHWRNNQFEGSARSSDLAMVVLYHVEIRHAFYRLEAAYRRDEFAIIPIPDPHLHQDKLHVYLSFYKNRKSKGRHEFSDSVYVGMV